MKEINIKSVIVHSSFSVTKIQDKKITDPKLQSLNYDYFVVISGKYKDGKDFSRLRTKLSLDSYSAIRDNSEFEDVY